MKRPYLIFFFPIRRKILSSSEERCSNFLVVSTSARFLFLIVSLHSLERDNGFTCGFMPAYVTLHSSRCTFGPSKPLHRSARSSCLPSPSSIFPSPVVSVYPYSSFLSLSHLSLILPLSLRSLLLLSVTASLCVCRLIFDAWMDME